MTFWTLYWGLFIRTAVALKLLLELADSSTILVSVVQILRMCHDHGTCCADNGWSCVTMMPLLKEAHAAQHVALGSGSLDSSRFL
jgi:hypothetical protein